MNEVFGFSQYEDHDFYHVRPGKGAVIVAVKKSENSPEQSSRGDSDLGLAKVFNNRDQETNSKSPYFDPIESIEEANGHVRVSIKIERRGLNNPTYHPVGGIIERVIPSNQVTFEVVGEVHFKWS